MLSHIPPWVFAILALLIYVGHRQTRPRQLLPRSVIGTALAMAGLSLWGVVTAFGLSPAPLLFWAIGMSIANTVGRGLLAPSGMAFLPSSGRVQVPGSWLPLGLMLGIFSVKFVLGFAAGVGAPVVAQSASAAAVALALGMLSGGFSARALAVRRVARQAGGPV
jgi:4-amino-4-deoxy-L-arabinose transferase-like glycosyltransferase